MTKKELESMRVSLEALVLHRRALGGYDANAEVILMLAESIMNVVGHLAEQEKKK